MLPQVNSVEELAKRVNGHVDCYVSTDAGEVEDVLVQIGFQVTTDEKKERKTLRDIYDDAGKFEYGSSVRHPKTGLEIDCVDVPIEEALGRRKDIDFMPMSKFRVYTNGSSNVDRILLPILKALEAERQNMAFFNDAGSTAYIKLSEFYR
jgi:hypothetical protein